MNSDKCNCMTKTPFPKYHKLNCPVRKGVKIPRLFYNHSGTFVPSPDTLEEIITIKTDQEVMVTFKSIEMTDEEFAEHLPEKVITI